MTLTPASLKDALLNARLPHIRVAIPSLGYGSKARRKAAQAPRHADLEQMFREDFVHLSNARRRPRTTRNPDRVPHVSARDLARTIRQAA